MEGHIYLSASQRLSRQPPSGQCEHVRLARCSRESALNGGIILKSRVKRIGIICTFLLLVSICIYLLFLLITNRSIPVVVMALFAMLLMSFVPAAFFYLIFRPDGIEDWAKEQEKIDSYLRQAMQNPQADTEQEQGILGLMLSNIKELRLFYQISRKQARGAFFLSAVMCLIGALVLFLSIAALLFLDHYQGTLTIGAVGGTIIEFVAATALFIYRRTLAQLNHYYRSLHENERFLSILSLTSRLSSEKRDEVYIRIIDSQLSYINQENWMNMDSKVSSGQSEPSA